MVLHFAYGSNMDWSQMKDRCPTAEFVCIAELPNHRLAFTRRSIKRDCGVADAVSDNACSVWGAVYKIDEIDIQGLDRSEGYRPGRSGNSYRREEVQVLIDGDEAQPEFAFTYFANAEEDPPLPSPEYRGLILSGARYRQLPEQYIAELEAIEVSN